jgi:hypothetical protein
MGNGQWEEQAGGDAAPEQAAAFALADNPGLSVDVDEDDNEANHAILHSDSGTKVGFTVFNVGTASGACEVHIEVDGTWVKSWTSPDIQPGASEWTEVKGLGRYPKGGHEFVAYVSPGAGHHESLKNTVDVLDP